MELRTGIMRRTACMGQQRQPVDLRILQCTSMSCPEDIATVWSDVQLHVQRHLASYYAGTVDDPAERWIFWGGVPSQRLPGGAETEPGALVLKVQLLHAAEGSNPEFDGRQVQYTACFHVDEAVRTALTKFHLMATVLGKVVASAEPEVVCEPEVVGESGFEEPVVRFTTMVPYQLNGRLVGYSRSDLVIALLPKPDSGAVAA